MRSAALRGAVAVLGSKAACGKDARTVLQFSEINEIGRRVPCNRAAMVSPNDRNSV
jgi:hypothetical protein